MKKVALTLCVALFCAQSFIQPMRTNLKEEWRRLLKELIFIRNSGIEKTDPMLIRAVAIALKDLEQDEDITLAHAQLLSEGLVNRYKSLKGEFRQSFPIAQSIRNAALILNRELTKSVVEQSVNPYDLYHYRNLIEQARNDVSVSNGGDKGIDLLKDALTNAQKVIESDDPAMALDAEDIRFLRCGATIAEDWRFESAAHAMLVAAAMSANKLIFNPASQPLEGTASR